MQDKETTLWLSQMSPGIPPLKQYGNIRKDRKGIQVHVYRKWLCILIPVYNIRSTEILDYPPLE